MNGPNHFLVFSKSGHFSTTNAVLFYGNPIGVRCMGNRRYAGYEEITFITADPVDGCEVLVRVLLTTLPPERID